MTKFLTLFFCLLGLFYLGCGYPQKTIVGSNCTPADSKLIRKLKRLDFEELKGKDVNSFLGRLKRPYVKEIPIIFKAGYIHRVMFVYSDSITIEIRVRDQDQQKRMTPGSNFDVEEFKKKPIEMICFRYGDKCVKGCEGLFCGNRLEW